MVITIDGPAGSGKSTTAKNAAQRLGFLYLDSGAMYRALTWAAVQNGIDLGDREAVAALASQVMIEISENDGIQTILLDGRNITNEIRLPEITAKIAPVAANPLVRHALVRKQRQLAENGSLVAEGRDMGTVVFPDADIKIYMDAPVQVRALRRQQELAAKGIQADLGRIAEDIRQRDETDSSRMHSPLRVPKDAIRIDTGACSIEEQINMVVDLVHKYKDSACT